MATRLKEGAQGRIFIYEEGRRVAKVSLRIVRAQRRVLKPGKQDG